MLLKAAADAPRNGAECLFANSLYAKEIYIALGTQPRRPVKLVPGGDRIKLNLDSATPVIYDNSLRVDEPN